MIKCSCYGCLHWKAHLSPAYRAFVTSISLYPATLLPFHRSKNFETVNSQLLLFFGDGVVIVVVECAIILGNVILIFHLICKTWILIIIFNFSIIYLTINNIQVRGWILNKPNLQYFWKYYPIYLDRILGYPTWMDLLGIPSCQLD